MNHAGFLASEGDLIWLNVVREPIERWASLFYYAVDSEVRSTALAKHALADRARDTKCGCAMLEFDECIDVTFRRNCTMEVPSQISSFCEPGEACSRELATRRLHERYLLVGLTEELTLTLQLLEKMLPSMFHGARSVPSRHRATSLTNALTNTSLSGAISSRSRAQIAQKAKNYKDEQLFYQEAKRLFFRQACKWGLL